MCRLRRLHLTEVRSIRRPYAMMLAIALALGSYTTASAQRYPVKPMFVDEAVLQLEMSHRQFLVFLNARSTRMNVLYRRKTGEFGLIEPTSK